MVYSLYKSWCRNLQKMYKANVQRRSLESIWKHSFLLQKSRLGNHLFTNEDQLIVFTFVTVFPWLKGKKILIISIKLRCVNLTSGILNILANLKQNEWWSEMYLIIPARTMSFNVLFQCCIMHAHVEQRSGRLQDALQFFKNNFSVNCFI